MAPAARAKGLRVSQQSLFSRAPVAPPEEDDFFAFEEEGDPDGLRWYQREMVEAVHRSFVDNNSVLLVSATGTGKTQTFGAIAKNWDGPVLVLAHRNELVIQARDRLEQMTGSLVEVEQGDWTASHRAQIVVGSTHSVMQQRRLDSLGKNRFALVICDEAHHYVTPAYKRILDFFDCKKLGVTATPDRADEKAIGAAFDDVAYVFDIEEGIDAGYLVPLRAKEVVLQEISLDDVGKSGRDLSAVQLDEKMVMAAEGVVAKTLELEPGKQGVAFFPGVKSAEYAALAFNRAIPGCAAFVYADTDELERRETIRRFRAGELRYLTNCGVFTEGFDAPATSVIIQARPTLSRALYAQMCGRGTRTIANVDSIPGKGDSALRRALIAASAKPNVAILDFVGSGSKHALVCPEDILGGSYSDDEVAQAKKKREPGGDIRKALKDARAELKALADATRARVTKATVRVYDPFHALGMTIDEEDRYAGRFGGKPLTTGQWDALDRAGVPENELKNLSRHAASRLLEEITSRRVAGLCTYRQQRQLLKRGITDRNITYGRAKEAMDYIAGAGWDSSIDPVRLNEILYRPREVGEDG